MLVEKTLQKTLAKADIHVGGSRAHDIRIHDLSLLKNPFVNPSLAAGEGYMHKAWDCDHLDEFFFKLCRHRVDEEIVSYWGKIFRPLMHTIFNLQSKILSKRVAERHYNLGNDFYRSMLGNSMAYTCAYWKGVDNLDAAQWNKFDLICKKIGLKASDKVLDLGCGWGSLAKYMAERYGCQVVAVNISSEQVKYAKEINQGLPVDVFLADYRDDHIYNPSRLLFDKVVSIGLCEHVGYKNYRSLFDIAKRNLHPDGLFLLHTIGSNDTKLDVDAWTDKYIFPGGMLPSLKQLTENSEDLFIVEDLHNFGADYDKTLMAWYQNFQNSWDQHLASSIHFDETFFRMWSYYLLSCAGAFRARSMQLWQLVLSPKGVLHGYASVR